MAIKLIESFQTYLNAAGMQDLKRRWGKSTQGWTTGSVPALVGGELKLDSTATAGGVVAYVVAALAGGMPKVRIGFKFKHTARPVGQSGSFLHLMNNGVTNTSNSVGCGLDTSGHLVVFYGPDFSAVIGTGSTVLAIGQTYWLELEVTFKADSTGYVDLRLNGVPEVQVSNVRTSLTSSEWIAHVGLVAGIGAVNHFSSLYVSDTVGDSFLGPSTVHRLALDGDTAQKDFTPSSGGSNYTLLNDLADATSCVKSGQVPATDLYSLVSLPNEPAAVHAVQVAAVGRQNSASRTKAVVPVLSLDGSAQGGLGSIIVPQSLPSLNWQEEPRAIFEKTPAGATWDAAAVSRMQVGHRVSSFLAGINMRQTAGYVVDPAWCTYCLNDSYPTTRGGVTFGWSGVAGANPALNRSTLTGDARLAGVNDQQNTGTQRTFKVDVPAPGRYQLRLCIGDYSFTHRNFYMQAKDGANVLFTFNPSGGTPVALCFDAKRGVGPYGMPSWPEYNEPLEITLTGTQLSLVFGTPTVGLDYSCFTHVELCALDYLAAPATTGPEVQVAGLYAEVLAADALLPPSSARPILMVCT